MMMNTRVSLRPTPFAVDCYRHGKVYLTDAEYERQLSCPDKGWSCPYPLCGLAATFDDDNYERATATAESDEAPAF
jgi:hypothetical protein